MEDEALELLVTQDIPEAVLLINQLNTQAAEVSNHANHLKHRLSNGDFDTNQGISFLEVKNHLLLSYILNLSFIVHRKLSGDQLEGDEAVDRLAEIRTVLEKMRPIDQKMKYQIDKMVRTAATGNINENDPLRFKANPENMMHKIDDDSASEEGEGEEKPRKQSKSKSYVPPKLSAVHYDGDETQADKQQKIVDKTRKRLLSSNIMQELRKEYDEGPEEIRENHNIHRVKDDRKRQQQTDYEEEYMTRLVVTKQDKHKSRQMASMSSLSELVRFEDISGLEADPGELGGMKKKKMKKQSKKSKKGAFRKRKWK